VAWVDAPWLRLAAPVAVGVVFIALWQFICTSFDVPVFLVPSPLAIATTLVEDWALLSSALLTTLKITFLAFALATVIGVADRLSLRAEPRSSRQPVPLRGAAAGHAHRGHRAADHHLGQEPDGGAGDLRHARWRCFRSSATPRWVCAASTRA
jgi:hypothetical protein